MILNSSNKSNELLLINSMSLIIYSDGMQIMKIKIFYVCTGGNEEVLKYLIEYELNK